MLKLIGNTFQFLLESSGSTKGMSIIILLFIDAFFLAGALRGKEKDGSVSSWPMFWVSIGLLFFILWYSNN